MRAFPFTLPARLSAHPPPKTPTSGPCADAVVAPRRLLPKKPALAPPPTHLVQPSVRHRSHTRAYDYQKGSSSTFASAQLQHFCKCAAPALLQAQTAAQLTLCWLFATQSYAPLRHQHCSRPSAHLPHPPSMQDGRRRIPLYHREAAVVDAGPSPLPRAGRGAGRAHSRGAQRHVQQGQEGSTKGKAPAHTQLTHPERRAAQQSSAAQRAYLRRSKLLTSSFSWLSERA